MPRHAFTAAETALAVQRSKSSRSGKAWRRLSRELAKMGIAEESIVGIKEIVVELIRAANSNPLIGIVIAVVIVDFLYSLKVISFTAMTAIYVILGIETSTLVADDISSILTSLNPAKGIFGGGTPTINPIEPSATTIVYGTNSGGGGGGFGSNVDLQALLGQFRGATK